MFASSQLENSVLLATQNFMLLAKQTYQTEIPAYYYYHYYYWISQLQLGHINLSFDLTINRSRVRGLIYSLESLLFLLL
jgi:hypothetical protein